MGRVEGKSDAVLREFAERVNKLARINLGAYQTAKRANGRTFKKRITSSDTLKNSIDYNLITRDEDGRFIKGIIEFSMVAYGIYVDQGRGKTKRGGNGKLRKQIEKWIRRKPLRIQDLKKGGFKPMSDANVKGLAYVIARRIHKHGTPATHFFSEPFNEELPKYQQLFAETVADEAAEWIGKRIDANFETNEQT